MAFKFKSQMPVSGTKPRKQILATQYYNPQSYALRSFYSSAIKYEGAEFKIKILFYSLFTTTHC
ncbi:MAG: hypothetical protein ACTHK8_06610 [Ginsengibacter sp.]